MNLIYTIGLFLYAFVIHLISPFNKKAKQFTLGRKNWKSKLPQINKNDEWVWFQASSQGEFEDGISLIKTIKNEKTNLKILLTFFSPSGYENKKNHKCADFTMYLPLDYKSNATYLLNHFRFKSIFFIRHDIWRNYLHVANKLKIPSYLIFCTLTPSSSTLKFPARVFFKEAFHYFNHIFCHDEVSKQLLTTYFNVHKASVSGSTRVENIAQKEVKIIPSVDEFVGNSSSVIIGSSALEDEKMLISVIKNLKNQDIKWIVVPHEVDRDFSHFENYSLYNGEKNEQSNVFIINAIGLLSSLYKNKDVAIIGGGFSKSGIHNSIEAAVFNIPVLFGPNHRNYPEALALLAENQAFIFNNENELELQIKELLTSKNKNFESKYIKNNKKTSLKILDVLIKNFNF